MKSYSIGKLARVAKVSVDTVRFYEKIGLLPTPMRAPSGYRRYFDEDLRRLRFVRSARNLGLSLVEIAELTKLERTPDESTRAALRPHLAAIARRMRDLQEWRSDLIHWVRASEVTTGEIAREFTSLALSSEHPTEALLCPRDLVGCQCADAGG